MPRHHRAPRRRREQHAAGRDRRAARASEERGASAACDARRPRLGGAGSRHELLPADDAPRDPRAAVLRRDRHPRHLPAAARPAGASTAASSRGLPSSTPIRWCGSRTRRARRAGSCISPRSPPTPCRCTRRRAARHGSRRSAASTPSSSVLKNGGFDDADKYGPNVIRSIKALMRELEATARRGYGLARNEAEPGVTALAAAIRRAARAARRWAR